MLPETVNVCEGYHLPCYRCFTALQNKYRINDNTNDKLSNSSITNRK